MSSLIRLGSEWVGGTNACYVIADIGSNHNGDFDEAKRLISAAHACGCNAVKFQSYTAEGLYSVYTPRFTEMEGRSHQGETPHDLIKRIQMPVEWHEPLKRYADQVGIVFASTPFDEAMVDVLEAVDVPFYKIASYEITHYPLLAKVAATGKPVILSTGNSDWVDIDDALQVLTDGGCSDYALLHCVSRYPAELSDMNLRCLDGLRERYGCVVGLSDHTTDDTSSIVAVAKGASIIEKHFTMDRCCHGPDHSFALQPEDFKRLVSLVHNTEVALGSSEKRVLESEKENHRLARRSIMAARDLKAGDVIGSKDIVVKRPALGIHPRHIDSVVGRTLKRDIGKDEWLLWEYLDGGSPA